MQEFKQGDVVRLKSGGPQMTVSYIKEDKDTPEYSDVTCCWFDDAKQVHAEIFDAITLTK